MTPEGASGAFGRGLHGACQGITRVHAVWKERS